MKRPYRRHRVVEPPLPVATRVDVVVNAAGEIVSQPRKKTGTGEMHLFAVDPLLDTTHRKDIACGKRGKSRGLAAKRSIYARLSKNSFTSQPPVDANDEGKRVITLKVHRVADPYDEVQRLTHGLLTGLSMSEFYWNLFELNEELPRNKKMTDETIANFVGQEFPESKFATAFSAKQRLYHVSRYRSLYNTGRLFFHKEIGRGRLPTKKSYRYDIYGLRMIPTQGRRAKPLSHPSLPSSSNEATNSTS